MKYLNHLRRNYMTFDISHVKKRFPYPCNRFFLIILITLLVLSSIVFNLQLASQDGHHESIKALRNSVMTPLKLSKPTEDQVKNVPLEAALVYRYPLAIDMLELVNKHRRGLYISHKEINPVNTRLQNHFPHQTKTPCSEDTLLILMIKSTVSHFEERDYIRKTWSKMDVWRGNSIRHVFVLGSPDYRLPNCSLISWKLEMETIFHDDVIVFDFIDNYYNNTMKMMSSIDWAARFCSNALFYVFVDDDFHINPRVIISHLKSISPLVYQRYFLGYNYPYAIPIRIKIEDDERSKWFIDYLDYPFDLYPSYVAAGFFIVSRPVLQDISIAMRYIKHLRFDDVFLGIVVRKLLIVPLHHEGISIVIERANACRTKLMQMMAVHMQKTLSPKKLVRFWWTLQHHMDYLERQHLNNGSLT